MLETLTFSVILVCGCALLICVTSVESIAVVADLGAISYRGARRRRARRCRGGGRGGKGEEWKGRQKQREK
jgi:hypothetical protein